MTHKNRNKPYDVNSGQNDPERQDTMASGIRSIQHDLYELLVRLRKNAANTEDQRTKMLFDFAAEVVAGLSRAFRGFEERRRSLKKDENDQA